jgi:hypothetical protein
MFDDASGRLRLHEVTFVKANLLRIALPYETQV